MLTFKLKRWALTAIVFLAGVFWWRSTIPSQRLFTKQGSREQSPAHDGPYVWKHVPQKYPVAAMIPLPSGVLNTAIPDIQAVFPTESGPRRSWRLKRLEAVREAMKHSWRGYKKYAWMHDEVTPLTRGYKNPFGGWGATLIDALDTLWIMGMEKEFYFAVSSLEKIDFSTTPLETVNVFETTIRYLGGLLAAYDITNGKHPILLEKAIQLGEMLYIAFDTPDRMPVTRWNWREAYRGADQRAASMVLSAEIGSLTLEFSRLSQLTGDPRYYDAVQRIMDQLQVAQKQTSIPGLWPMVFDVFDLNFHRGNTFTMGGMADSLYEYIPKEYLMLGGLAPQYRDMYESFIEAAKKYLFFRPLTPDDRDALLSGTATAASSTDKPILNPEGQHLTCFVGGMIGLASKIFDRPQDLDTAKKLVEGCIWAYETTPTGIMPEIFRTVPCLTDNCSWTKEEWYAGIVRQAPSLDSSLPQLPINERAEQIIKTTLLPPGFTLVRDTRYILRPEAIESIFILYRITGNTRYQDIAWTMFTSIERACETDISFAALHTVLEENPAQADSSESFWMAETLKYFFLIFSEPDVISLDEYVFNTEAHPLKRPKS